MSDSGSTFSVVISNIEGTATVTSNSATLNVQAMQDTWTEGIAMATGALARYPYTVGFSKSGGIFSAPPSSDPATARLLTRANSSGTQTPLMGNLQSLDLGHDTTVRTNVCVLEHSNGNLYVSVNLEKSVGIGVSTGNGGRVYRITRDGSRTVIYDSEQASIKITPFHLVECLDGQLCTWDINTLALYKISNEGALRKFTQFLPEPTHQINTLDTRMALAATQDGHVFASILRLNEKADFRITPDGVATAVDYGGEPGLIVSGLSTFKNHVYALTILRQLHSNTTTLIRRAPNGTLQRIAGGVSMSPQSLQNSPVAGFGSLPGWLWESNEMIGTTSAGRIGMCGWARVNGSSERQNFLITPPPL